MTFTVYALVDPRDRAVRYVGLTTRPLEVRLESHRRESIYEKRAWLRELDGLGVNAEIQALQILEGATEKQARLAERSWIDRHSVDGRLFNQQGVPAPLRVARTKSRGGATVVRFTKQQLEIIEAWRKHLSDKNCGLRFSMADGLRSIVSSSDVKKARRGL